MSKYTDIIHEGIVTKTEADSVTVLLSSAVACTGCEAGGSCSLAGAEKKILKVEGAWGVRQGEKVVVSMKESQGYSALMLGYVIPLAVLLLTLVICEALSGSELFSGLMSIAVLVPYYILLFAFRSLISKKFTFKLLTKSTDEFNSTSDDNQS
jgi:sigma-E factor negative regulatory protein RseC